MGNSVSSSGFEIVNPEGDTPTPYRIIVAASGTGGHLIPALHIVSALKRVAPGCVIEFIGAGRPLEEKLIVEKGYTRHTIASAGVKRRKISGIVQFLVRLPKGLSQISSLYRSFRPDVVVGVGGYVSVLPVIVARLKGIPTWIHEAERQPGLANRVLAYFADRMSTAFGDTTVKGRVQVVHTGHPVREELSKVDSVSLRPDAPKRLLILGGSQGARGLDDSVSHLAPLLAEKGIEVVHQCRPDAMELVVNSYRAAGVAAHVVSFIDDMAGAYDWSDVIISRAGASSVAEISCVNRPTIFVPYPFQQGTHQTDNAMVLVNQGKALLVEETQPDFAGRLKGALEKLLTLSVFKEMKDAPGPDRATNAASAIAEGILALVTTRRVA
jgi:UDP-N-acetylglucosamine--N-acetylmuramyl-(pentapeptide) pyrophosphoryl-undecaprenol N-acetylglucosamine transferase